MKVLRVISSMDPSTGGPCQGIRNSIPALKDLGVSNEVVCLDEPNVPYVENEKFPIHALGSADNTWGYNSKLFDWLCNNLSGYDVVVIHGLWQYHSYAVWKAVKQLNKRSLDKSVAKIPSYYIMPHGMLDPYFQRAAGRKMKALRNWAYWKLIENKVVKNASGLLFTCEEELRLAREPFKPYAPRREINVGYGIAEPPALTEKMLNEFYNKCPQLKGRPYFLFLSRIHKKKGVLELIRAYEIVKSAASGNDRENFPALVIAGPGLESAYGREIVSISTGFSVLSNSVYFPGMLNGDVKWGAFYNSEIFILPSHQENFGIVVAEALACRKPVLISNKVNIWPEIEAAGGGMVEDDTMTGTINLIRNWCGLPATQKDAMAINARKTYESKFTIKLNAVAFKEALSAG